MLSVCQRFWLKRVVLGSLAIACSLVTPLGRAESKKFLSPDQGYQWSFPRDHGEHEGFQTEWWYYTGHLYEPGTAPYTAAPRYGFQLTFFKRVVGEDLSSSKVYLAHATLTEIQTKKVYFANRIADGVLGAANIATDRLKVALGDWSTEMIGPTHVLKFSIPSDNESDSRTVRLVLDAPDSSILLQGRNGYSKKGTCERCASLYYSIPHISVKGEVYSGLSLPKLVTPVRGIAWMDHEVMSNALAPNQTGWDWMALTFSSGEAITVFQLRDKGGDNYRSLNLCRAGSCEQLPDTAFTFTPEISSQKTQGKKEALGVWKSTTTGATYPVWWRLSIPNHRIDLLLKARVEGSELVHSSDAENEAKDNSNTKRGDSPVYWEGPVATEDEKVIGYLEMTGYVGKVDI